MRYAPPQIDFYANQRDENEVNANGNAYLQMSKL